ncbi:MarR family winged helix-turn-helix transcriptional regulator [Lampropedia puyangensis]|nr:MarR family transcriptional regulator [Lampropedia puyangensis]
MRAILIHMRARIDQHMVEIGLTDAQWMPISFLATAQARTASDLARCSMQGPAGMTRMLDRLESKGFVRRERSKEDRRVVYIELTPQGRSVADAIPSVLDKVNAQVLRDFSEVEARQFKSFLQRALLTLEGEDDPSESDLADKQVSAAASPSPRSAP